MVSAAVVAKEMEMADERKFIIYRTIAIVLCRPKSDPTEGGHLDHFSVLSIRDETANISESFEHGSRDLRTFYEWFLTGCQRRRDVLRTHINDHGGRGAVSSFLDLHINAYDGCSKNGTSNTSA